MNGRLMKMELDGNINNKENIKSPSKYQYLNYFPNYPIPKLLHGDGLICKKRHPFYFSKIYFRKNLNFFNKIYISSQIIFCFFHDIDLALNYLHFSVKYFSSYYIHFTKFLWKKLCHG